MSFGRSSDPNKSFRFWKVLGLALAFVAVLYCVSAGVSLYEGKSVRLADLPGLYLASSDDYVIIEGASRGRLVSKSASFDFAYTYAGGTLSCSGPSPFLIRALGGGDLFSLYDFSYLWKKEA